MATDQTDQTDRGPAGDGPVLVTGATGYIGGLLVPELLRRGRTVRVLSRSADRIAEQDWGGAVEVAEGDASDADAAVVRRQAATLDATSVTWRRLAADRPVAELAAAALAVVRRSGEP